MDQPGDWPRSTPLNADEARYVEAFCLAVCQQYPEARRLAKPRSPGVPYPPSVVTAEAARYTPRPCLAPKLLTFSGPDDPLAFTAEQCERILDLTEEIPADQTPFCATRRRLVPRPLLPSEFAAQVEEIVHAAQRWWGYDVDLITYTRLTYPVGGSYFRHVHIAEGIARKFFVLVQLTAPDTYEGGDLVAHVPEYVEAATETEIRAPRERGSVIVHPSWLHHSVTQISRGTRESLAIEVCGPPFR